MLHLPCLRRRAATLSKLPRPSPWVSRRPPQSSRRALVDRQPRPRPSARSTHTATPSTGARHALYGQSDDHNQDRHNNEETPVNYRRASARAGQKRDRKHRRDRRAAVNPRRKEPFSERQLFGLF